MPPTRKLKTRASSLGRSSSSDSDQGAEDQEVEDLEEMYMSKAKALLENANKRRAARNKSLDQDTTLRAERLQSTVVKHYEEERSRIAQGFLSKFEELEKLVERRIAIVGRINAALKGIEDVSYAMAVEMNAVYASRVQDIQELEEEDVPEE